MTIFIQLAYVSLPLDDQETVFCNMEDENKLNIL